MHDRLSLREEKVVHVVSNGSQQLYERFRQRLGGQGSVHLFTPVTQVSRQAAYGVRVTARGREPTDFTSVMMATDADIAMSVSDLNWFEDWALAQIRWVHVAGCLYQARVARRRSVLVQRDLAHFALRQVHDDCHLNALRFIDHQHADQSLRDPPTKSLLHQDWCH